MKVLEKSGIEYDLVVGSSVGSLIGAFWSAGYTASEIDEFSMEGNPSQCLIFHCLQIGDGFTVSDCRIMSMTS